jgi:hypothetical protein
MVMILAMEVGVCVGVSVSVGVEVAVGEGVAVQAAAEGEATFSTEGPQPDPTKLNKSSAMKERNFLYTFPPLNLSTAFTGCPTINYTDS